MAFIEPMHRNKPNITYLLIPSGPTSGYAGARDIYVYIRPYAQVCHNGYIYHDKPSNTLNMLINMFNPIYIYVRSIT